MLKWCFFFCVEKWIDDYRWWNFKDWLVQILPRKFGEMIQFEEHIFCQIGCEKPPTRWMWVRVSGELGIAFQECWSSEPMLLRSPIQIQSPTLKSTKTYLLCSINTVTNLPEYFVDLVVERSSTYEELECQNKHIKSNKYIYIIYMMCIFKCYYIFIYIYIYICIYTSPKPYFGIFPWDHPALV